jgi:hypothetical protein
MPTRKVRTVNLAAWTDERPGMHCRSVLYAERVVNIGILIGFSVGFGGYPRSGGRVRSPLQSDRRRSNFGGSDGKLRQRRKTAGPDAGGESPSGDDATVLAGYFRVGGEGFVFGAAPHPLASARGRPKGAFSGATRRSRRRSAGRARRGGRADREAHAVRACRRSLVIRAA